MLVAVYLVILAIVASHDVSLTEKLQPFGRSYFENEGIEIEPDTSFFATNTDILDNGTRVTFELNYLDSTGSHKVPGLQSMHSGEGFWYGDPQQPYAIYLGIRGEGIVPLPCRRGQRPRARCVASECVLVVVYLAPDEQSSKNIGE